jgi:hypothetical protein
MRCHGANRVPKLCCDCKKAPLVQYGRCTACFRLMDRALYARLKNLTRAERAKEFEKTMVAAIPRWQWPGNEEELIAKFGENQDLKLGSPQESQNVGIHEGR